MIGSKKEKWEVTSWWGKIDRLFWNEEELGEMFLVVWEKGLLIVGWGKRMR